MTPTQGRRKPTSERTPRSRRTPSKKTPQSRRRRRKAELAQKSRLQRILLKWGWVFPVGALIVGVTILLLTYAFASIPLPRDVKLDAAAKVFDRNGDLIGIFTGEQRRFIIDTSELDPWVAQAVISAEDRDFYEHNGVSLRGIARAAIANVTGGEVQQGGSTISQQYVKNAVLEDASRTATRKIKEAILAVKLERRFSKEEILGFYLNTIYLGRGAYGIEAAADAYFNKKAEDLTLAEAAYLASIIPSPERYQPDEFPAEARARRDRVLDTMVAEGHITQQRADKAKRKKVRATGDGFNTRRQRAAYFMEWIRKDFLEPEFGNELYTGGLEIHTTLDLRLQDYAEEAVASVLTEPTDPQASLVSMTPRGEVLAFVGGRDFTNVKKARGVNYGADLPGHQSGSALKPFTLLAAIEDGISPRSRFSGASPGNPGAPCPAGWNPENFGGSSFGTLDLVQATTSSVNTIFAQLAATIGPEKIADVLMDFRFAPKYGAKQIEGVCALALGSFEATPVEMARGYAGFAGRGRVPNVIPVAYVTDGAGNCIKAFIATNKVECDNTTKWRGEQAVDQNSVDVLNQSLQSVVTSGTATGAAIPGRPVAGKTGTAQENVAAWFAGHIPQMATAVWMGYPVEKDDNGEVFQPRMGYCSDPNVCRPVRGMEVTGGSFPVQIWGAYMRLATEGLEVVPFPTPTSMPGEVINAPPPTPTEGPPESPEPEESKPPEEEEPEPEPDPDPTPDPTPDPEPTAEPTVVPSPASGGGDRREDDP